MNTNIIVLVMALLFITSCVSIMEDSKKSLEMNNESCKNAGGHWNKCGSPCAGTDAEVCIQVCEEMCECGGEEGWACPDGYNCRLSGKVKNEIGKCILE